MSIQTAIQDLEQRIAQMMMAKQKMLEAYRLMGQEGLNPVAARKVMAGVNPMGNSVVRKRVVSPEAKQRMKDAQARRWAAFREKGVGSSAGSVEQPAEIHDGGVAHTPESLQTTDVTTTEPESNTAAPESMSKKKAASKKKNR